MRSGKLRARIVFQTEDRVDDGAGGAEPGTWTTFARVRGEYMPERGREAIAAGHIEGSNLATLRVRYSVALAALTTQSQAIINGVQHQIRAIMQPDQKKRTLEMVVERGTAPFS